MTDYDALNARLLARRKARKDEQSEYAFAKLSQIEQLVAEFHRLLEVHGFPQDPQTGLVAQWLKFENGSESLAWMLATKKYFQAGSDERSSIYVMLDGQIVVYQATGEGYVDGDGYYRPIMVTHFMTYRHYVDNRLGETAGNLYSELQEVINRLHYMISCLHRL